MKPDPKRYCAKKNPTRSTPVQYLKDSQEHQPEIKEITTHTTANHIEIDKNSPPKNTTSQVEERRVRDETTNECHCPPQLF